jgi:hypothetical protein
MKNGRNFHPYWDISTYKRPTYCIWRSEHSAHRSMLRNKPNNTENAILLRYCRKWPYLPSLLRYFDVYTPELLHFATEHSAHCSMLRNKANNSQNPIIRRLRRKMSVTSIPIEIFRRISGQITASYSQYIVHTVVCFESSSITRKTQSFYDIFEKWP